MAATIYKAALARLAEYPATAARFGDDVTNSRAYTKRVPTGTAKPYLSLTVVSNPDVATHMRGDGDLYKPTLQIDVCGDDLDVVLAAAQEVRDAMRPWSGEYGGLRIIRAFKDSDFDDEDDPQRGAEELDFRVVLRYEVWYKIGA